MMRLVILANFLVLFALAGCDGTKISHEKHPNVGAGRNAGSVVGR